MREYSFDRIPYVRRRDGLRPQTDHREVIAERASAGWEFVQAIPFETAPQPHLELVFTREAGS